MSKIRKYGFRAGFRGNTDPQAVGEELDRIREVSGSLTAEGTVKAAEKPTSPLHDLFVWDNTEAARLYRLVQARTLIRSVTVVVEGKPPISRWISVHTGPRAKRRYDPIEVVAEDADSYQSALQMLEEKLAGAARAVQELREAAGQSKQRGKLALINVIIKALETATEAVKRIAA